MASEPMDDDVAMKRLGFTSLSVRDEKVPQLHPTTPPQVVKHNGFGQRPLSPTMSLDSTASATSETDLFSAMAPSRSMSMSSAMSAFSIRDINGVDTTTDEFRMYSFKVLPCTLENCQDWNKCPYAHPEEKATRRDTRKFHYMPEFCQALRKNTCPNGDACLFSHSVFETWLHPAKYRTQMCKKLTACERDVCFFAHTQAEFRAPTPFCAPVEASAEPFGDSQLSAKSATKKRLKAMQAAMQKAAFCVGDAAPPPPPQPISRSVSADSKFLHAWSGLPPAYPTAPPPPAPVQTSPQMLETLYHAQKLLEMCSAGSAASSAGAMERMHSGQLSLGGGGMDVAQLQMAHSLALQILRQPQQAPLHLPAAMQPPSQSNFLAPGLQSHRSVPSTPMAGNSYSPFQSPNLFQNPSSFFTL